VWRFGASGNFHDRERQRGSAKGAAFRRRRRHPSHCHYSTIGFGEFERRPEIRFDVAVAELGAPAPVGGEGGGAAAQKSTPRDSACRLDRRTWRAFGGLELLGGRSWQSDRRSHIAHAYVDMLCIMYCVTHTCAHVYTPAFAQMRESQAYSNKESGRLSRQRLH
jgi:hypothetical protein